MKYIYELIGTFFLVLTIGMAVVDPNGIGLAAPIAIGSILTAMIYAGGHVSGAHYNPAVSFAAFLRHKISAMDLGIYWLVQFLGGVLGAVATIYLKGEPSAVPMEIYPLKAFVAEFLFTFALCYVVLNVATTKTNSGNSFYGWAIGFTVVAGAYAMGAISSAAFNPAVALGISILNLSHWPNLWIYFIANLSAAGIAAWILNQVEPSKQND